MSPAPARLSQCASGKRAEMIGAGPEQLMAAPPPGEFERFCETRDRREEQSQSARYVSRETTGYEDLRPVWLVAARAGIRQRLGSGGHARGLGAVSVRPLGLGGAVGLDVDRPGPVGLRALPLRPLGLQPGDGLVLGSGADGTAPGLCARAGGVRGRSGCGAGVAWFPLGPREVYRPAYRVSDVYVQRVNVTQVNVANINVTNVQYVNRGAPGGTPWFRETSSCRRGPYKRRPCRWTRVWWDELR